MIQDHPQRYSLANELHARPYPAISATGGVAYIALKKSENAASRDKSIDRDHLINLLDRFGAVHPQLDATHYSGEIGRYLIKWESHTEFVTYTLIENGVADKPFDGSTFSGFPEDWLASSPGNCITSVLVRIERESGDKSVSEKALQWFVPESLAVSNVLDQQLTVAGDFRIDSSGYMRFAIFAQSLVDETLADERRIGRLVQQLCEIETYKSMAMLGFSRARQLGADMTKIDQRLTAIASDIRGAQKPEEMLAAILDVSADLENLLANTSFRFGATAAYDSIVAQRIEALREQRIGGMQTFAEFMTRRFDPAMRTVVSARNQLEKMAERSQRASDLLRTRVDVERSAQNQALLESMDKRSSLQLRLQKTVEGMSVVAISYYAVGLALYVLTPLQSLVGISKTALAAIATPVVVFFVWRAISRIRNHYVE